MSHIREKDNLLKLKSYMSKLDGNTSIEIINDILDELVPKTDNNKNMIGVIVSEGNKFSSRPGYMPSSNTIIIPKDSLIRNSDNSAELLAKEFCYDDKEKLSSYYQMFSLLHEVEHGYQFLIAKGILKFPYIEVKAGYEGIINSIYQKNSIIPNPIRDLRCGISFLKYQANAYSFVLERNAEVEASNDTCLLAREVGDEEIADIFDAFTLAFQFVGYEENEKGCMYQTYLGILRKRLFDKIKQDDNMSEEDRLRFGLSISNETRNTLMKRINNCKLRL